jgi:hypothetical protein
MIGGETVEAAMIGRDSLVGGSWGLDGRIALNKGIAQIAGEASVMSVDQLCKIANANLPFRTTIIRRAKLATLVAFICGADDRFDRLTGLFLRRIRCQPEPFIMPRFR